MKPFSLEISVIQLASASSFCSSSVTIGVEVTEVVSDVCSSQTFSANQQPVECYQSTFKKRHHFKISDFLLCGKKKDAYVNIYAAY